MIVDKIFNRAASIAKERAARLSRMGAWSVGRCVRLNWYMEHAQPPDEPIDEKTVLVFELGDKIEDILMSYITSVLPSCTRTSEPDDTWTEKHTGLRVRPDFVFMADSDFASESVLGRTIYVPADSTPPKCGDLIVGEIKSMSSYAFDRAQRGQIDDAYLAQVEVQMRAYNARHALMVAYRKESSDLCEILIETSNSVWQRVLSTVAAARADKIPARPYTIDPVCSGCSGTGKTAVRGDPHKACNGTGIVRASIPHYPCGYCVYKTTCWGPLQKSVDNGGRVQWFPLTEQI